MKRRTQFYDFEDAKNYFNEIKVDCKRIKKYLIGNKLKVESFKVRKPDSNLDLINIIFDLNLFHLSLESREREVSRILKLKFDNDRKRKIEKKKDYRGVKNTTSKKVIATNTKGEKKNFDSIGKFTEFLGLSPRIMYKIINGEKNNMTGWKFEIIERPKYQDKKVKVYCHGYFKFEKAFKEVCDLFQIDIAELEYRVKYKTRLCGYVFVISGNNYNPKVYKHCAKTMPCVATLKNGRRVKYNNSYEAAKKTKNTIDVVNRCCKGKQEIGSWGVKFESLKVSNYHIEIGV